MIDWIKGAFNDLIEWLKAILQAVFEFFTDIAILILDGILSAIATLIEQLVAPTFMSNGLQYLLSGIDPSVIYFLSVSGFAQAIAIIGTGYTFRLARKAVTLFQW